MEQVKETKVCSKCGTEKDLSEFHKDRRLKDRVRPACKSCLNKTDKREIIPELPPAQQINWIRKAQKVDLFGLKQIDGPDSRRPGGKPPADFEGMSPQAIMATGYKK